MNLFQREITAVLTVKTETSSGRTITISGTNFHIGFNVSKSDTDSNNTGHIFIYNLSDDNRLDLNIDTIGYSEASIYANYASGNSKELLYTGDICEIKDILEGGDILTTLSLATGFNAKKKQSESSSFLKDSTLTDVVQNLKNSIPGITINSNDLDSTVAFSRGLVINGNTYDESIKLLKNTGHSVVNEDNTMTIKMLSSGKSTGVIHTVNKDTGMIGIPEQVTREEENLVTNPLEQKPSATPSTENPTKMKPSRIDVGYRVTMLLNSGIKIHDEISITSKRLKINNLRLVVALIEHEGSNHDTAFYTTVEAYQEENNVGV